MIIGNAIGIPFGWGSGAVLLPSCARDLAVSWHKNLNTTVEEGDTYPYVKDSIGTRTDDVYYGQYLDATSGQINFLRTSGTFDYTDPSDGTLVEGVSIPGTGLYTIPANGICDIGVYPRDTGYIPGLLNFDRVDDYVSFSSMPDVTGSKTVTLKLFLPENPVFDSDNEFRSILHFHGVGEDADHLALYYTNYETKKLNVQVNTTYGLYAGVFADYDSYSGRVIDVEIVKTAGAITSFTVDCDIQSFNFPFSVLDYPNNTGLVGIGGSLTANQANGSLVWDININDEHQWQGQPNGNQDVAWEDSIGSIDGTVNGSPTVINVGGTNEYPYLSFYPTCEHAGTVLHDTMENSIHISVDAPSWSESLYGTDYLNQQGFVDKTDSDALGYDWETLVNITPITLNDNTLVPLAQWGYQPLLDSEGDPITDSEGDPIYTKDNI